MKACQESAEHGRQLGIVEYKAPGGSWQTVSTRTLVPMDVGYRVKFLISGNVIDIKYRSDSDLTSADIQTDSANERIAADQMLQLGETIQIGRMTWVVRSRSIPLWKEEDEQDQVVELEATDRFGANGITVVSRSQITADTLVETFRPGEGGASDNHVGLAATPLSKQARAVIRPTRECDCLEVGIRSQVWQQFNGLCNFSEVPSPEDLEESDEDNEAITNGTMNLYSVRSSCFTVKVRPAGLDSDGNEYAWGALHNQFVVTGRRPVDVFNYLRFEFPQAKSRYEFRFEPLPGATVIDAFGSQEIFEQLDAANGTQQRIDGASPYGVFQIYYTGRRVAQATLLTNKELGGTTKGFQVEDGGTQVTQVEVLNYRVDNGVNTGHGKPTVGALKCWASRSKPRRPKSGHFQGARQWPRNPDQGQGQQHLFAGPAVQAWLSAELYGGWIWDRPRLK